MSDKKIHEKDIPTKTCAIENFLSKIKINV